MENEFNTLSQHDIDALVNNRMPASEPPADPGPPLPIEPEGPLPKVINLTGLSVSSVVPDSPVIPPASESQPPAASTGSATKNDRRIEQLEQSVAESNATVQQLKQEMQALIQQVQVLSQSLESISMGLSDTPSYRARETFTCGTCESQHNVAMPVKCTQCGRVNWWGWWPRKEH